MRIPVELVIRLLVRAQMTSGTGENVKAMRNAEEK